MRNTTQEIQGRAGVAEEVRAIMARRRTNQAGIAKVLHLSQGSVSRRLSGEVAFDVDELYTLAEHFDVPVTDLFPRRNGPLDSPRYLAEQVAA